MNYGIMPADPGQAMSGPSFLGEQPSDAKAAAGGGPKGKVILGKDGKPIPEPEKTWMQKNWLIIMIGAAVVSPPACLSFAPKSSWVLENERRPMAD